MLNRVIGRQHNETDPRPRGDAIVESKWYMGTIHQQIGTF